MAKDLENICVADCYIVDRVEKDTENYDVIIFKPTQEIKCLQKTDVQKGLVKLVINSYKARHFSNMEDAEVFLESYHSPVFAPLKDVVKIYNKAGNSVAKGVKILTGKSCMPNSSLLLSEKEARLYIKSGLSPSEAVRYISPMLQGDNYSRRKTLIRLIKQLRLKWKQK